MTFAAPLALWGLLLLVGPVLVHLLSRRTATRRPFPTLRLLEATRLQPVSRRVLDDRGLLLLRLLVLLLAVLAMARPTWSRADAAEASVTARAVIVDTSASVRHRIAANRLAADRLADSIEATGLPVLRVATADPAAVLPAAAEWLVASGGGELVVLTDGQPDVLREADVRALDARIGVRTLLVGPVGDTLAGDTLAGDTLVHATPRLRRVVVHGVADAEAFALLRARVEALVPAVTIERDADVVGSPASAARPRDAATTPARVSIPLAVTLSGLAGDPLVRELVRRHGWPVSRAAAAPDAAGASASASASDTDAAGVAAVDAAEAWWPVRDADDRVVLTMRLDDALHVRPALSPSHPVMAALIARAVERRRAAEMPLQEYDARIIPASTLAQLQRPATSTMRGASTPDQAAPASRMLWLLVLAALGLEWWWRTRIARRATPATEAA